MPSHKYTTEEMMELFPCELQDEVRESILNLGVSTRYFASPFDFSQKSELRRPNEEPGADVCAEACNQALEQLGLGPEDIDYLIATYDASSFLCPGLSNILVHRLGFPPHLKHASIQGMACTAFTTSLQLAADQLARFPDSYIMISLSGVNSNWFCEQVRGLKSVMGIRKIQALKNDEQREGELRKWIATIEAFLFGDGAASIIIANEGEGPQVKDIVHVTNIGEPNYLAGYARLTGSTGPFKFEFSSYLDKSIPRLGTKYTSAVLEKLFERQTSGLKSKIKKWAVHTGSRRILDSTAEHHGIDQEKLTESYEVLANYGNLAGASLPFIFERIISHGETGYDDYGVMLGYGWGFSAGAALIKF